MKVSNNDQLAERPLSGQDRIDVAFVNDYYGGPGDDRNLYVDYVVVGTTTVQAEGPTLIDRGGDGAAFDGLDVLAGQEGVLWNGALRVMVGARTFAAGYDVNGNMTHRVENGQAYAQEWDVENRLVAVTNTVAGQVTRFYRDADGNLVKKSDGAGTVMIVGSIFEHITTTNQSTSYYMFGGPRLRGDDGVAMRVAGVVYWLHGDHLGSASLTTSITGTKVAELRYLPFGETRWMSGTTPTDRRYTGQREVPAIGLYDYNARMYWPAAGRFVSADTVVPGPGNPQAFNRYAYALNNPLRYNDPTGHDVGCSGRDASHCSGYNKRRPIPFLQPSLFRMPIVRRDQPRPSNPFIPTLRPNNRSPQPIGPEAPSSRSYEFTDRLPPFTDFPGSFTTCPVIGIGPLQPKKPVYASQFEGKVCLLSFGCDYQVLSAALGPLGPTGSLYFADEGIYLSVGVNVSAGSGISLFDGHINGSVPAERFLVGASVAVNGGLFFGIGHTWSLGASDADEGGLYVPAGIGVQLSYTVLRVSHDGITLMPGGQEN